MTTEQIQYWTLWVYFVGLWVQLGGFIVLVFSITHLGKTFRKSAIDNVFSDLSELHKVFVEHPEMRPYFYDKKTLLDTDAEFQRGRAIAEMFFDAFIHMFQQRHAFPKRQQRLLSAYLVDILSRSDFLLEYLHDNIELLDPIELRQQVEQMHASRSH